MKDAAKIIKFIGGLIVTGFGAAVSIKTGKDLLFEKVQVEEIDTEEEEVF